jgi:hypothetical protein
MSDFVLKSLDSIGQHGAMELRRVFPMTCSNDTILDVFCETCVTNGYVIIERTTDTASAVKEFYNMYVHSTLFPPYCSPGSNVYSPGCLGLCTVVILRSI